MKHSEINNINFTSEEVEVLQSTIEEVRETEGQLLVQVLEDHLRRKPTNEDGEKIHRVIDTTAHVMRYILVYDGINIGEVRGETNIKGGVRFTFTPNKSK